MTESNREEGSLRPDGTRRKVIKVRPGYVPQEERPKYNASERRKERASMLGQKVVEENNTATDHSTREKQPKKDSGLLDELSVGLEKLKVEDNSREKKNSSKKEIKRTAKGDTDL